MAPSPTDPETPGASRSDPQDAVGPPSGQADDPLRDDGLAHLRSAAGGAPSGWSDRRWVARLAAAVDELRGRPDERTGRWPGTGRTVAVGVSVALVVAGLVWWGGRVGLWGGGSPTDVAASLPRATTDTTPTGGSTSATGGSGGSAGGSAGAGASSGPTDADLVVQAAGAVVAPGVYHLPAGARVGDLVERAGGFAPDADVDRVNLAAPLADGARVWVPRRGQPDPTGVVGGGDPTGAGGGVGSPKEPVDLNTATAEELDALPGIGPSTAAAIIDHRQRNGPFRSVDELADVRGIGDAKLAQLRDLVRV